MGRRPLFRYGRDTPQTLHCEILTKYNESASSCQEKRPHFEKFLPQTSGLANRLDEPYISSEPLVHDRLNVRIFFPSEGTHEVSDLWLQIDRKIHLGVRMIELASLSLGKIVLCLSAVALSYQRTYSESPLRLISQKRTVSQHDTLFFSDLPKYNTNLFSTQVFLSAFQTGPRRAQNIGAAPVSP